MIDESFFAPSDSAEIEFWGNIPSKAKSKVIGHRIRMVEPNQNFPRILTLDEENTLQLWDLSFKRCISSIGISDVLNLISSSHQSSLKPQFSPNFCVNRISARSHRSFHSRPGVSRQTYSNPSTILSSSVTNSKDKLGEIRQIAFEPTQNIKCSKIYLVFSEGCVFFDFYTRSAHAITAGDIGKSLSSMDFISSSLLALGCVDGSVRIWDLKMQRVINKLEGHKPGPVFVKNLLRAQFCDGRDNEVRLLSVGVEGGLVWACPLIGNILNIDPKKPSAILLDSAAGLISGSSSIFHCPLSHSLQFLSSDKLIRSWSLAPLNRGFSSPLSLHCDQTTRFHLGPSPLSAALSRSCPTTILHHPQLSSLSLALISKSSPDLLLLQGCDEDDGSRRLQLIQQINLPAILSRYISQMRLRSDPSSPSASELRTASLQLKVLTMISHTLFPNHLFLGTNFGFIMLKLNINNPSNLVVHPNVGVVSSLNDQQVQIIPTLTTISNLSAQCTFRSSPLPFIRFSLALLTQKKSGKEDFECSALKREDQTLVKTHPIKPTLLLSPSGKYLALFWQNSLGYSIFDLSTWTEQSRGSALTIAWAGYQDQFVSLRPCSVQKDSSSSFQSTNRRMSIQISMFSKKEDKKDSFLNQSFTFKKVGSMESTISFDEKIQTIFGGPLLCVVSTSRKIDSEFKLASQLKDKFTLDVSEGVFQSSIQQQPQHLHRSRFYQIKEEESNSTCDQIGPLMPPVHAVSWNLRQNICSVLLDERIVILLLSEKEVLIESKTTKKGKQTEIVSQKSLKVFLDSIFSLNINLIRNSPFSMCWDEQESILFFQNQYNNLQRFEFNFTDPLFPKLIKS